MQHVGCAEPRHHQSVQVKICGITSLKDALCAAEAGADALGFVFFKKSPRYIEPQLAKSIIAQLPPLLVPVGIFVNEELDYVRTLIDECGLALAQLHGDEPPTYCEALGRPVLRGIRLRDRRTFLAMAEYRGRARVRGFVIDAYHEAAYGGTGQQADWNLAAEVATAAPILLAGGLTPDNVEEAIRRVQPYGVDVSSGVESSPGKKDPSKVHAFIHAVKLVSLTTSRYTQP
ncbi:MAG: phosphoribosylanthranilate isomerase [Nitrospirae bacterium]|nr:MAG: phosphoribosylanthranilate isomerase [Nitrospirota bacterium]